MKTAVLIDGDFYLRRHRKLRPKKHHTPEQAAKDVLTLALAHMDDKACERESELYRILVYDAPPLDKRAHMPVSKKPVNFRRPKRIRSVRSFIVALSARGRWPFG